MTDTTTELVDERPPAPTCSECEAELRPAGRGEHRYWTCGYCGETVPA